MARKREGEERERWGRQRERDALLLSALLPQRLGYRSLWCSANFKFHYREPPSLLPFPFPLLSSPSLLLRLNKLSFLPPNAEVKKLKALQKRLFVWVNYSLGCSCMCQMYVCKCVCLYEHARLCESWAGSGVESWILWCLILSLIVLDRLHPLSLVTLAYIGHFSW